jgi:ATP synthase protein I
LPNPADRPAPTPDPAHEPKRRWREWDEGEDGTPGAAAPAPKALTREEAQALRSRQPTVSPWRVLAVQAVVGVVVSLIAWGVTGRPGAGWSALYGAAVVVVPGALMARGMTSRLTSASVGTSAVSFLLWEMVKIAVSVAMLMLAPKVVQSLSWPALLVAMVVCMKVYWFALLWRGQVRAGMAP